MINKIETSKAPTAIGPYSQGTCLGDLIFTSGQVALSPEVGDIVGDDIASQTRQVMRNLEAILKAAGSGFNHVLKTTCFITDMAHFDEFNGAYAFFFPANKPARSTVAVKQLPKGALVEVEAIAVKSRG